MLHQSREPEAQAEAAPPAPAPAGRQPAGRELTASSVLALQRSAGNQAVRGLLQRAPAATTERMQQYQSEHKEGLVPKLLRDIDPSKADAAVLTDLLAAFKGIGFEYSMANTQTERFLAGETLAGDCQTLVRAFVEVAKGLGIAAEVVAGPTNFGVLKGAPRTTIDGKQGNCDNGTKWVFDDHYWAKANGQEFDVLFGTVGVNKEGWTDRVVDPAKAMAQPYGKFYLGTYYKGTGDEVDVYATGLHDVAHRYTIGPDKDAIQHKQDADVRVDLATAVASGRSALERVRGSVALAGSPEAAGEQATKNFKQTSAELDEQERVKIETANKRLESGALTSDTYKGELGKYETSKRSALKRADDLRTEQSQPAHWAEAAASDVDTVVGKFRTAAGMAAKLSSAGEKKLAMPDLESAFAAADEAVVLGEKVRALLPDDGMGIDDLASAKKAFAEATKVYEQIKAETTG